MIKTLKLLGWTFILFCLCLFTLIDYNNIYFVLIFCIIAGLKLLFNRQSYDNELFVITCFAVSYFIVTTVYYQTDSMANSLTYLLGPPVFYMYGQYLVKKLNATSKITSILLLICLIPIIPMAVMLYHSMSTVGIVNVTRSLVSDGEGGLAATLYGLVAAISLSGLGIFTISRTTLALWQRIGFLLAFCLGLLTVVHLVNRTGIIIAIVMTVIVMATQSKGKVFVGFATLAILLFVISQLMDLDVLNNVTEAYEAREQSSIDMSSGGGRFVRWIDALSKLWFYPVGWWQDHLTYYDMVHNLWLDIARVGGIVPFFMSLWFLFLNIKIQIKLLKFDSSNQAVVVSFGMLTSILIASSVEPVIEAKVMYFFLYICIAGMEKELYRERFKLIRNHAQLTPA